MKIVQPIGTIAGTAISKIAITLAEEFARQGHESTLVVWNRDKIEREIDPRVRIVRTNLIGVSRRNIWTKLLRLLFKPILGPQLFLVFMAPIISRQLQKKVLDKGDYDVTILHAHSVFNFRYIKIPYLVVAHSLKSRQLLEEKPQWKKTALKKIYRKVYSNKHIGAVSKGIGNDLVKSFQISPASLRTINNPLDVEKIRQESTHSCDQKSEFVIAVGRNSSVKRFDRLLRIYAQANIEERLLILGRAAENTELQGLAGSLGLEDKVIFLGFKANPYPYIANAKCLLVTSDYEGFGMVIVEALALGTPVISTDCPCGPREILEHGMEDCLIPVDGESLFAERLVKMMSNPIKIDSTFVDRFTLARVAEKYVESLNYILGEKSASANFPESERSSP